MTLRAARLLAIAALAVALPRPAARAADTPFSRVGVDERLGETLPLAELTFADEDGRPVVLRDLVDRPTVLLLVFFRCAGICTPLLQETARVADLAGLKPGEDYRVLTVSFDPSDTPAMARTRKGAILQAMTRRPCPPDGWRFLTGRPDMIARITGAAGFRYEPVDNGQSFNHPAVIAFLDRTGKVCRYLYGMQHNPTDFELAVGDASAGRPRSIIQTVRQMCFAYDPDEGYVVRLNRIILVVTLLFAAGFGAFLWLTTRRRKGPAGAPAAAPPAPPDEGRTP
jgi:protein SCO1/2